MPNNANIPDTGRIQTTQVSPSPTLYPEYSAVDQIANDSEAIKRASLRGNLRRDQPNCDKLPSDPLDPDFFPQS